MMIGLGSDKIQRSQRIGTLTVTWSRMQQMRADIEKLKTQVAPSTVYLFMVNVSVSFGSKIIWQEKRGKHAMYITAASYREGQGWPLIDLRRNKFTARLVPQLHVSVHPCVCFIALSQQDLSHTRQKALAGQPDVEGIWLGHIFTESSRVKPY